MGDRAFLNVITSEDDMAFFRTILKFMKKLTPLDNFEFRQAVMYIVKKYAYKKELAAAVHEKLNREFETKEEPSDPMVDEKENVMREINKSFQKLDHLERQMKEKTMQSVKVKTELVKQENINPCAAALARGFLSKQVIEIESSDNSDIEEVKEVKPVIHKKMRRTY